MSRSRAFLILTAVLVSVACDLVTEGLPANRRETPISNRRPPLLLHSTMDSAQEIFRPVYATTTYPTVSDAIPGPAQVTYEPGRYSYATRLDSQGFHGPTDAPLRFHGDNFDYDDADDNGGRLDFWIKFNEDPHTTYENTWVARSNYGPTRYINYEFAGTAGTPANLMIDVYGEIAHNDRTNYANFRVTPRGWDVYENIRQGEWHLLTVTWRRNGGPHKAELHLYIDGTQEGCIACNDYNGNLPGAGSVTDLFFSPPLYGNVILFSVDEVYSFDSWDVSGLSGNFADLQIPEGVTLTYPMLTAYPVWGSPVSEAYVVFEFFVINYESTQCGCDLYVDNVYVHSVTTTTQAHTEIANPNPLATGLHAFQVKCDNDRLVSAITQFEVTLP